MTTSTVTRHGREVQVVGLGTLRLPLWNAVMAAVPMEGRSERGSALVALIGSVTTAADPAVDLAESADEVGDVLRQTFLSIQDLSASAPGKEKLQNILLIVDSEAALGDAERVADSVLADSVISMARSLSQEVGRARSNLSVALTATIEREPEPPVRHDETSVADRLARMLDEDLMSNGQEVFVGGGSQLGRLRP